MDIVFTPQGDTEYDLERILEESDISYWRWDAGYSSSTNLYDNELGQQYVGLVGTALIPTYSGNIESGASKIGNLIYDGKNINANSMQLSASFDCLGIKEVLRTRDDGRGNITVVENESVGQKWVIQPQFETPIPNFGPYTPHPISPAAGTVALPLYASASCARGIWHQFGVIPSSPKQGVFIEIADIPKNWLRNHWKVNLEDSMYNFHNSSTNGKVMSKRMKPLTDIIKFNTTKKRLGEYRDKMIVKEAIVAIPFVEESGGRAEDANEQRQSQKKFFNIPQTQRDSANPSRQGTTAGDSLDASGVSIRKTLQMAANYNFPPQFDPANPDVPLVAMYIFEFEYKFDRDDLNYMWQNLAPRDYQKMALEANSFAHVLGDNELLSADDVLENENLKWMVFKVKQKSGVSYDDLTISQAGQSAGNQIFERRNRGTPTTPRALKSDDDSYQVNYNWPYDFMSFVEMIKFDVEILYQDPELQAEEEDTSPEEDSSTSEEVAAAMEPVVKDTPPPDASEYNMAVTGDTASEDVDTVTEVIEEEVETSTTEAASSGCRADDDCGTGKKCQGYVSATELGTCVKSR